MNILKKSEKLFKEARKIILTSGFHDILASYSTVYYTGSYALDLMVWPDIDIEISIHDSPFNKEIFFEIGKQIAQLPNIISMKFKDHHAFTVDSLPNGLYWNK